MGSVLATSKSVTGGSPVTGVLLPEPQLQKPTEHDDKQGTVTEMTVQEQTNLRNPGTIEDLHRKSKDLMPVNFEGAKLMVNKGLSNHFQISHTINLATSTTSGYRFGATYVGTKQLSPTEAFPVILGEFDPSGNLNANIIHQLSNNIKCKFAGQIQNSKMTAAQLSTDYKGNDYTASLTVGNPNPLNESGVIVAHYLQSITNKLALGGELAYQRGPAVPGNEIAIMSAALKYENDDSTWSCRFGLTGINLCYYQKASEQLKLAMELDTNFRMQESTATISYQIDLPKADIVFRGMVDTNWNVAACMEKKLLPLPFLFALSGILNHTRNSFRLGVGLIIG